MKRISHIRLGHGKIKSTFALVIALTVVFFSFSLLLQNIASSAYQRLYRTDSQYYLPSVSWLNFFTCRYNEAAADIIWTKFILYFGSAPQHAVKKGELAGESTENNIKDRELTNYTVDYVNTVTRMDPMFLAAYEHGARLTMYHRGVISRETIEMAIRILERGIHYFSDDGMIRFNLGFLYYYEMIPFARSPEEKEELKIKGANIIYHASHLKGAPHYASALASSLLTRHGMNQLAIQHLSALLLSETDPDIRAHLEHELMQLTGSEMEYFNRQMEKYAMHWKRNYSFIPFDLYTVLEAMPLDDNDTDISLVPIQPPLKP
ncbi:MAG: hypothetical protein JXX14_24950 [Deltaproteobacteria bacterium]|nr:hypothetical protein [Deltaproteobacteria bacterium]